MTPAHSAAGQRRPLMAISWGMGIGISLRGTPPVSTFPRLRYLSATNLLEMFAFLRLLKKTESTYESITSVLSCLASRCDLGILKWHTSHLRLWEACLSTLFAIRSCNTKVWLLGHHYQLDVSGRHPMAWLTAAGFEPWDHRVSPCSSAVSLTWRSLCMLASSLALETDWLSCSCFLTSGFAESCSGPSGMPFLVWWSCIHPHLLLNYCLLAALGSESGSCSCLA